MNLKELVRSYQPRIQNAAIIHEMITRPQLVRTPRKVMIPKDAETLTWETLAVAEIETFIESVTGSKADALKRIAALNSMQMLGAVRAGKKSKPDRADDINARSDALILLYLDAGHRGYPWPLPADFGQPEKVVDSFLDSPGQSIVETECPGEKIPTMADVAAMME